MAVYTRQELTQLDADNIQSRSNIRNANEVCVNVINLFKTKLPEDGKTYDFEYNFDENGNSAESLTLKDTKVIDTLIKFGNDIANNDSEDEETKDIINSYLAIEAMYVIAESSDIRDEATLNIFDELYKTANNIIVQYGKGKGKKPCRTKSCIQAQRMFSSWPTWALALMIGVQAAGEQQGHAMNDDFATRLHCAWCLRWDPSGGCCP